MEIGIKPAILLFSKGSSAERNLDCGRPSFTIKLACKCKLDPASQLEQKIYVHRDPHSSLMSEIDKDDDMAMKCKAMEGS
jgi:hypothetical protein